MAVGENGIAIKTTTPVSGAGPRRDTALAGNIHRGTPESTGGGPGCTTAPAASLSGSGGSSPYGKPAGFTDTDGDG